MVKNARIMSLTTKIDMPNTVENQQNHLKQSLEEKKALLKKQIQELKCLKNEIKQSLNISTSILENNRRNFSQIDDLPKNRVTKLPSGNFSIKNELFNFAGIQCIKSTKDEYIFHFIAKGEGNKSFVYSVQFFKIDNKGELGKWMLPTFIDINWILKETPMNNIVYAVQFVRNCKHYIDCYHNRMNQFVALKKSLEKITNCTLDADRSYKYINIELFGVYDVEFENLINIIVYLVYDLKEARPQQIKIDSRHGAPLDKVTEDGLKLYLKSFKKFDLKEAFEKIENGEDSLFSWQRLEKVQTLLDEQNSEKETSLTELLPKRKRQRRNSSKEEIASEKELNQKNKGRSMINRKMSKTSGEETRIEIEYKTKPTKSKFQSANNKKLSVKTGLIQKKKSVIKVDTKKVDISQFLTKKNKDKTVSELEDSNKSANEESEKESPPEEARPLKEKATKPSRKATKPSHAKLTSQKQGNEVLKELILRKGRRKDFVLGKISEHETLGQGRVLRSATNSPKKVAIQNKISPSYVVPLRKLVSPKKIVLSKKLASFKKATSLKIQISPKTVKTNMKQTSLKIQSPNENSPSTDTSTIKLDYKPKLLKSKVVTSTPMALNRKIWKLPLEDDLNISEIKFNENVQTAKT